jgi:hypothetical protein
MQPVYTVLDLTVRGTSGCACRHTDMVSVKQLSHAGQHKMLQAQFLTHLALSIRGLGTCATWPDIECALQSD